MDNKNTSEEVSQCKTGKQHQFEVKGYPYIIYSHQESAFEPDDSFTLESNDGTYSNKLKFSDAEMHPSHCILWFRMPPKSPLYSLRVSLNPRTLPDGQVVNIEYCIFQDELLTYRTEEESSFDENATLREEK